MKKLIILIISALIFTSFAACTKEDPKEETTKVPKNAVTDYVDRGVTTIDQSRDLVKDSKALANEKDKMLDDIGK